MRRTLLIAVLAAFLLPASATAAAPLAGTSWTVKRVGGRRLPPGSRREADLRGGPHRAAEDRRATASAATTAAGASRLRFLDIVSTAVGCDRPA